MFAIFFGVHFGFRLYYIGVFRLLACKVCDNACDIKYDTDSFTGACSSTIWKLWLRCCLQFNFHLLLVLYVYIHILHDASLLLLDT